MGRLEFPDLNMKVTSYILYILSPPVWESLVKWQVLYRSKKAVTICCDWNDAEEISTVLVRPRPHIHAYIFMCCTFKLCNILSVFVGIETGWGGGCWLNQYFFSRGWGGRNITICHQILMPWLTSLYFALNHLLRGEINR